MNMSKWVPKSVWGWAGIAALVVMAMYRRSLTVLGFVLLFGLFWWGYFVKDTESTPAA